MNKIDKEELERIIRGVAEGMKDKEPNITVYMGLGGIKGVVKDHGLMWTKLLVKCGDILTNQESLDWLDGQK